MIVYARDSKELNVFASETIDTSDSFINGEIYCPVASKTICNLDTKVLSGDDTHKLFKHINSF